MNQSEQRTCHVRIVLLGLVLITVSNPVGASIYNLHLQTDSTPDYTDINSYVHSITDAWSTPQEKAIAVWRWDRRSRRQTSNATEDGRLVWDPIQHFNSYGSMNCGVISSLNISVWKQLGFRGRYIQLGDHTVSEVSWDEGKTWHLFDSSMSMFCFNHEGVVASMDEIRSAAACELSGGKSEKGHFYLYHGPPFLASHLGATGWRCASDQPVGYNRTLAEGASSYTDKSQIDKYCQYARSGMRYTLNLRPEESYTRYWEPLDRNKAEAIPKEMSCYRPVKEKDPDVQHDLYNIRGSGRWIFAPDLAAKNAKALFEESGNLALNAEDNSSPNLHPAKPREPAHFVYKVYAANVITSMLIELTGLRAADKDGFTISVSRDAGLHWTKVWSADKTGLQSGRIILSSEVAGVTQCLIRFDLQAEATSANVGIDTLKITTLTQVNRLTLPKLKLGSNTIALRADEQTETTELWPALHNGAYKQTAIVEKDVTSADKPDGMYKSTLGAAVNNSECSVTWKLAASTDIVGVDYNITTANRSKAMWVALQHSWDGTKFDEFNRKAEDTFPVDEQVHHTISKDIPAGAREAYFRGVFFAKNGAATYNMPGLQEVFMRLRHKPRNATQRPIEVTYCWIEHRESGDVERMHTQIVEQLPAKYTINTTGRRDPTMKWVRMMLVTTVATRPGYSDNQDVGPVSNKPRIAYAFSNLLSASKPYTASRPAASANPDSGGAELTNGIIIAPTEYSATKAVQPATALWDAGEPVTFTIDLERSQPIAAVRVSTHQPNSRFCHPAQIEVAISDDNNTWRPAGTIYHDECFIPPADFEAWEHEDSPQYRDLPATGRLAYSYPLLLTQPQQARYVRLTCTPQKDRGMGLSELQIFGGAAKRECPRDISLVK